MTYHTAMILLALINITGWGSGLGWLLTCALRVREEDSADAGDTKTARRAFATPGGGMAGTSRQGVDSAARPAPTPLDQVGSPVDGRGRNPQTRKRPAMTGGPITNRSVIR